MSKESTQWGRWETTMDDPTDLNGAIALACGVWNGRTLWLVDHNLREI